MSKSSPSGRYPSTMDADEITFEAALKATPDDGTTRLVYADWLADNGRADDAYYQRARVAVKPVLADPDDDAARLAFADWCDGQDRHARAALIRKQIELSGKPPCPVWCDHDPAKCARTRLEFDVRTLLGVCGWDVWCGPPQFDFVPDDYYPSRGDWGGWWRAGVFKGFVEVVVATGPAWVANADHLLAHHPVRNVYAGRLPELRWSGLAIGRDEMRHCWFVRPDGSHMPSHPIDFARFPDAARHRVVAKLAAHYWPGICVVFQE